MLCQHYSTVCTSYTMVLYNSVCISEVLECYVSTSTVCTSYTMVLYNSVCISEVLVHSNSTFVCLLHEAAEQCGHVLETWRLSVVFDQTVYEGI